MSNPYKEIVKELANSYPYFTQEFRQREDLELCFYCATQYKRYHRPICLYLKAKTLLAQNPDNEEDNPWIPCSEGMPTDEDSEYEINLKTRSEFIGGEFDWYEYCSSGNDNVVSWRPRPKPYEPPVPTPEPDSKHKTTVIGRIKKEGDRVTVEPIPEPEKPPEPIPDPLLGWTPVWKKKPKVGYPIDMLFYDRSHTNGSYSIQGDWLNKGLEKCIVPVAWKYIEEYPDPKLFEKPTPPAPKHLPPDFTWKRLCEELPTKPGRYYFFDEDRNIIIERIITKDRSFKDAQEIQRLIGCGTHWVLLSVFV